MTESRSPTLQVDSLPAEPQGKPKNTGVGSLSILQWIFPTGIKQRSALQVDSLPTEVSGKPTVKLLLKLESVFSSPATALSTEFR